MNEFEKNIESKGKITDKDVRNVLEIIYQK